MSWSPGDEHAKTGWFRLYMAAAIAVVVVFQNCQLSESLKTRSPVPVASADSGGGGNGTGYGGKLFIELAKSACPDLTKINRRIEFIPAEKNGGKIGTTLVRDDCRDLTEAERRTIDVPEIPTDASFNFENRTMHLEAILDSGIGIATSGPVGDFAPALSTTEMPEASYADGTSIGASDLFVASVDNVTFESHYLSHQMTFRLFRRNGMQLSLLDKIGDSITVYKQLDDQGLIHKVIPFGSSHVAVLVRTPDSQIQSILLKITGDKLAIVEKTLLSRSTYSWLSTLTGQSVDSDRYLLINREFSSNVVTFRILSVANDKLISGQPVGLSSLSYESHGPVNALPVPGSPNMMKAFLPLQNVTLGHHKDPALNSSDVLKVVRKNLSIYTLRISGDAVEIVGDVEESGSYEPVDKTSSFSIIGNAVDALLLFINDSDYKSYDSFWGRYSHGTYRTGGKLSNLVPTNSGNATDLVIGNLTFFRIETDLGTRILFLEPTSQVPRFFNTAYPRAHYGASARLIRSNDHLVLIEGGYLGYAGQGNIVGRVRVLSVPQ